MMSIFKINIKFHEYLILVFLIIFVSRFFFLDLKGTFDMNVWISHLKIIEKNSVFELYAPNFFKLNNWNEEFISFYPPIYSYILYFLVIVKKSLFELGFYISYHTLIKSSLIIFEILLFGILFIFKESFNIKNFNVLLFSLIFNPALIISGSMLGYVDIYAIFFLILSLLFILNNSIYLSIFFFFTSILTKQLSLVLLPIYIFYIYKKYKLKIFLKISLFSILLILIFLSPFIFFTGLNELNLGVIFFDNQNSTLVGLIKTLYWGTFRNDISSNGLNIWWIYSSLIQLIKNWSFHLNFFQNIFLIKFEYMKSLGGTWNLESLTSKLLMIIFTTYNLTLIAKYPTKNNFLFICFLQYYSYSLLATGVHENHFIFAVPLILINILYCLKKEILILSTYVSLFSFINMFYFYGFAGDGDFLRNNSLWSLGSILLCVINIFFFIYSYKVKKIIFKNK